MLCSRGRTEAFCNRLSPLRLPFWGVPLYTKIGLLRTLRAILRGLQNSLFQKREAPSAIHGALNRLELVDLSLDRSIAVWKG